MYELIHLQYIIQDYPSKPFMGLFPIPVFDDFFSNFSRDAVEETP